MNKKTILLITFIIIPFLTLIIGNTPAQGALKARHRAVIDSPDVKEKPPVYKKLRKILDKQKKEINNFVTPSSASNSTDSAKNIKETGKIKKYYDRRSAQVYKLKHPDHELKSGIFGRLAFYGGLLTVLTLLLAFVISSPTLAFIDAVLYCVGFFGGIIFGLIGITRRKKRGKAIIGLSIILLQIMLFAAIASFASAVAAAAPVLFDAMVVIMLMGKGG